MKGVRLLSYILIILGLMAYLKHESEDNVGVFTQSKKKKTIASVQKENPPLDETSKIVEENKTLVIGENPESISSNVEEKKEEIPMEKSFEISPQDEIYKSRLVYGLPKRPAACLSDYDGTGCILRAYYCVEIIQERVDLDEASYFVNPVKLTTYAVEMLKKEYGYTDLSTNLKYQNEYEIIKNEKEPYWKARYEEYRLKSE